MPKCRWRCCSAIITRPDCARRFGWTGPCRRNIFAVLGTPGGSRIITMVVLGILDFFDGNGPDSWVSLPRFHHQYLPDEISAERKALSEQEIGELEALGHEVSVRDRPWGNMHGVLWNRSDNTLEAAHDPRWESGKAEVRP
ncbi:MAG: gamma-glutamyltransferase [Xanthomonadaceae bacterium]|nr:gamma-glutamyltransferase [Xanthomonadaceae bacterium]